MPAVTYAPGMLVMYDGEMFECLVRNTNQPPPMNPTSWRRLPAPPDDVRLPAGSPYTGIGLN